MYSNMDDFSQYKEVHLLKKKSDAFSKFKNFMAQVEKKQEKKVKSSGMTRVESILARTLTTGATSKE